MKKIILILISCLLVVYVCFSQSPQPQEIPSLQIIESLNVSEETTISSYSDIIINHPDNANFIELTSSDELRYSAGKDVIVDAQTEIRPTGNGSIELSSNRGAFELVWFTPTDNVGFVEKNDKLELGISFQDDIEDLVTNFINDASPNLNPFNPNDIDIVAEFWFYQENGGADVDPFWIGPLKSYGFYYEDFQRITDDWIEIESEYRFRTRFSPGAVGTWMCRVTATFEGTEVLQSEEFTFECIESNRLGNMEISENQRFFEIEGDSFFPIGQNLPYPTEGGFFNSSQNIATISEFDTYHDDITNLANSGANYYRMLLSAPHTDIEYEVAGDYSGRMKNAYEVDRIFELTNQIELDRGTPFRMHFDIQAQLPFEVAHSHLFLWDWSGVNHEVWDDVTDPLSTDLGYCYANDTELNLNSPEDFFTSEPAKEMYKRKLRYILARWGYSTSMGVLELFSEINNAGTVGEYEDTDDLTAWGSVVFTATGNQVRKPYPHLGFNGGEELEPDNTLHPYNVGQWQIEMANYLKSLDVNHPISNSYAGPPWVNTGEVTESDLAFANNALDVNTYNSYKVGVEAFFDREVEANYNTYTENLGLTELALGNIKPFMFSEIGGSFPVGDGECVSYIPWYKGVLLSPFSGATGAMNWRESNLHYLGTPEERNERWQVLGHVAEFMSELSLERSVSDPNDSADEWWSDSDVRADKKADLLYLRSRDGNDRRAAGAVHNRTWNYYTQAAEGDLCGDLEVFNSLDEEYQNAVNVQPGSGNDRLRLENMGSARQYTIDWFNPFTGELISTSSKTSGASGGLTLEYPTLNINTLSLEANSPVVYFKAYPHDDTFKSMTEDASTNSKKKKSVYANQGGTNPWVVSETGQEESMSDFENSMNQITTGGLNSENTIKVYPNPFQEKLIIQVLGSELEGSKKCYIYSTQGELLKEYMFQDSQIELDLSSLSSGIYYIKVEFNGETYFKRVAKES